MASRTEQCGINPVMARSQEGKDVYYTSSSTTTTTTTTMGQKKQSEHQSSASRNQEKRKYPEHRSIIAATTFKRSRQQSEVPSNHQQLLHQRTLDGFVKSPTKIASHPYSSPPSETSRVKVVSNTGSIEAATTTTTPIDVIDLLSSDDDEDELVPIQKRDAATMERPIRHQKQHSVANNSSERPQMRQRSGVAAAKHSQNNVSSPKQQHQQQFRFKTKSLSQPRVDRSIARSRVVVDVLASDDDDAKLPAVNSRHRSTQQQSSIPSAVNNHAPSRKWTGESSTQQPRGVKPLNPLSSQPIPRVNRRGGSRNVIDVLSSSDDDDSDDDVKLPAVNRPNELPAERQSLQHDSLATGTMKHVPACQKLERDSIAHQQEPHVNNQIVSKKQSSPLSHPCSHAAASPTSEAQSSNSCTAFTDSLTLAQHLQAEFLLPPPPIDDNSCRLYTAEEFKSMWNKVEVNIGFTTEELEDGKLVRKANKTISRQDSTEQEKAQYGRLLFEATDKVLTDVLDVRESDVFLDIGHGIGNTVNQAVFTKGCRGRGIEVVGDRHLLAMQYTKDLDGQHKRDEEHNDVHRPIGHIRFREGRFEEPVHRDFLTKVEGGVIKAMCNNFNGVFGDRCAKATKDSLIYTLDNHLAALLAHMKPGSVLATLHSLGQYLGPSMSEVKEARTKHSLQSNSDALSSFYEVTEFDIGDATKSVSWSANSGTKNRITVYKYTRLDQGAATDRPVMLCTNPQCEAAIQARPFVVTKFHVIAGENRLLMSAFCPDCLVTESSKRSRKAIKYYE